jgi:probable HAF family extracellular repeat protein
MKKAALFLFGIILVVSAFMATQARAYEAFDLDPGYQYQGNIVATSVNDLGAATVSIATEGWSPDCYYVDNGSWTSLGDLNEGVSVNNDGQVAIVQHSQEGPGVTADTPHAGLWYNGSTQLFQDNGFGSIAYGIDNGGTVAGSIYTTSITSSEGGQFHAAVWSNNQATILNDYGDDSSAVGINNLGQVVGYAISPTDNMQHAVIWTNGIIQSMGTFNGYQVNAVAINDLGQVAGTYATNTGIQHAFIWQNGSYQDLGTLGGQNSYALGINNLGQVVGQSQISLSDPTTVAGFVWSSAGGIQELGTLGGQSCSTNAINDSGYAVGWANDALGNTRSALWDPTVVPEPACISTLFCGIVAMAGLAIRKRAGR